MKLKNKDIQHGTRAVYYYDGILMKSFFVSTNKVIQDDKYRCSRRNLLPKNQWLIGLDGDIHLLYGNPARTKEQILKKYNGPEVEIIRIEHESPTTTTTTFSFRGAL